MYSIRSYIEDFRTNPFAKKRLAKQTKSVLWVIFRALLLFGLCFVILYPILYMLSMWFRPTEEIYDPSVIWIPKSLVLDNIKSALHYMDYWNVARNSLLINLVSSLFQVATCAVTGYGFARFQFKGKNILFTLALFTIIVPSQLTIIPLSRNFAFFDFFGIGSLTGLFGKELTINLLDTPFTFYLPAIFGAGIRSGLFIFMFRQFFRGMPKELEDAGAIDGCGFFRNFISIMLPNATSIALTAIILSVVWYWNDYYYASMYIPNYGTVSLALTSLSSVFSLDNTVSSPYDTVTLMQAGAILALTPLLVMYIVHQRFFVQGVERSGIVG